MFVNTTDSSDQLVRKCDGSKYCEAIGWGSVSQADNNATCKDEDTPETNVTLPGDQCENDADCLCPTSDQYNATCSCTSGACKTSVVIGDFCDNYSDGEEVNIAGTNFCPAGSYCDTANTNCTGVKGDNATCAALEECPTGWGCVQVDSETEFTCKKYFSLTEGTKFDKTKLRQGGLLLTVNDMCGTHHYIDVDGEANKAECRKASVGVNATSEDDLKREDGPTENDCSYTAYNNATDPDDPVEASDTSLCGFNKDGASYCNKRKGDKWFQEILKTVKGKDLASITCHANSPLTTCVDAGSKIGTSDFKKWVRELLSTTVYGNYANNDNCVASSVTAEFWQGDSPDFAFNSLTMSSLAGIVLTISALFYMF